MLMEELTESSVKWGYKVVNVVEEENEYGRGGGGKRVALTFANGETSTSSICVGADGIYSATRDCYFNNNDNANGASARDENDAEGELGTYCDASPSSSSSSSFNPPLRYLDCIVCLGITSSGRETGHSLCDGETVFQCANGDTRLYAMPYDESKDMWQISWPMAEEDAIELCGANSNEKMKDSSILGQAIIEAIMKRCGDWMAPVPNLRRDGEKSRYCVSSL
jgi:hypothetical protein